MNHDGKRISSSGFNVAAHGGKRPRAKGAALSAAGGRKAPPSILRWFKPDDPLRRVQSEGNHDPRSLRPGRHLLLPPRGRRSGQIVEGDLRGDPDGPSGEIFRGVEGSVSAHPRWAEGKPPRRLPHRRGPRPLYGRLEDGRVSLQTIGRQGTDE